MANLSPSDLRAWDPPIGITSLSLGRASVHRMEDKLRAAADAGFKGIEIFYEDLQYLARELSSQGDMNSSLIAAAQEIRRLCDSFGMTVINLQPFMDYEGLISRELHQERISKLKTWFILCKTLGTDLIVITSVFPSPLPIATGDKDIIIQDLREVADLGAKQDAPIRFAYEAITWGAHINTWQHAWQIIQEADKPNLGLCIDTFHILAKAWANPESITGLREDATDALRRNLQELAPVVSANRLFSVQLADAMKLDPPLSPKHVWHDPDQDPLMTWSRQARLFPLEKEMGGYLPVLDVLRCCVVDLGYRGCISLEVFNSSLFAPDPRVPMLHAERGMRSWMKCRDALRCEMPAISDSENKSSGVEVELGLFTPNYPDADATADGNMAPKPVTVTTLSMANPLPIT